MLTNDERELIFGHPFPEYGKKMISIKAVLSYKANPGCIERNFRVFVYISIEK